MYQSLAYFAAATTTATNIALIISLVPLISLILSIPILGQRISRLTLIGTLISFTGLVLMLSWGNPAQLFSHGINQGDSFLLMAAVSYAL
ncbi:EamA family transporter [Shewanella benthica]|uniref:EamA family transporter n=1 Tax=Shewanella benthica TaxID=43661 RepID=UPI001E429712|nr:EamA family transporter [Shewanella benthica]